MVPNVTASSVSLLGAVVTRNSDTVGNARDSLPTLICSISCAWHDYFSLSMTLCIGVCALITFPTVRPFGCQARLWSGEQRK